MARLIDADALSVTMKIPLMKVGSRYMIDYWHVTNMIEKAPTIDAEQHWISVSERLPETYGEYIVTRKTEYGIKTKTSLYYENGIWWPPEEVIAWMPLPEPYRGEE